MGFGMWSSIIDSRLRLDPFPVSMLDLLDLAHRVSQLNDLRMGISPRLYEVHLRRLFPYDVEHLLQVHQVQEKGIVDLI